MGAFFGLPSLRLRGLYLLLSTFALHFIALYVFREYQNRNFGFSGISFEAPSVFGFTFDSETKWYYLFVLAAALTLLTSRNLLNTREGRSLVAIRDHDVAAGALGVAVGRQRIKSFAITSFITSAIGALYVYYLGTTTYEAYSLEFVINYFAIIIIGGMGSLLGSVLGAVVWILLPQILQTFAQNVVPGRAGDRLAAQRLPGPDRRDAARAVRDPDHDLQARRPERVLARHQAGGREVAVQLVSREAPVDRPAPVLSVAGLEVAYGPSAPALRGVTIEVPEGSAVALLGPNGAGKTTTIRAISGLLRLHSGRILAGSVELGGEDISKLRANKIVGQGVAQVPEGRMVFAELTVEENLRIGATARKGGYTSEDIDRVFELFPSIASRRNDQAGWLSGGEQQMVAIGRGLMANPRLLLLDEVSLGLAPIITRAIFERLRDVRADYGTSMLVVEQNARLALEFCDYAYILDTGRIVLEGPAAQLRADPQVQELYLGGEIGEAERSFAAAKRYRRRRRWLT